ncbi:hypothetical protein [Bacillus horti]|uniref:DUF2007 domain-containing protein n=1 Tax=Caldalkalibacillus horti TaxID=77523 RepID=A0ABT9VUR9_9BACI|nr:hypothetical protein [Bacillus horti]MDQ0164582.1 hypothetical protein [Bacillus horti]
MEFLIALGAIVVIFGGIVWYRKTTWKVYSVASSQHTDDIREKYDYLKEHDIRCKLENVPQDNAVPAHNHPANFSGFTPPESSLQLLVHKNDVAKADEVLEQMSYA